MPDYQVKLKGAAYDNLKAARENILRHLGNRRIGERLASMNADEAGDFANDLLGLLDAVDSVLNRAQPSS